MLQYRKDKVKLLNYINAHKQYFSDVDEETGNAIEVLLSSRHLMQNMRKKESGGVNMCQALEEYYQDGVNEGIAAGIETGIEQGKIQLVCKKLKQGISVREIADWMEIEEQDIYQVKSLTEKYPDADSEQITEKYLETHFVIYPN